KPSPAAQAPQVAVQMAPRITTPAMGEPLDLSKLTGRWDAIVERLRAEGKPMLAGALEHSTPVSVTAAGVVTIELDEPNDIYTHALTTGRAEIVNVLREWFTTVERVDLRRGDQTPSAAPKRLTDEMVRADRIASLK